MLVKCLIGIHIHIYTYVYIYILCIHSIVDAHPCDQKWWKKIKKAQKPSFKTERNCFSHGWKSMKVIPWRHWIGHKQTLRLSNIGISAPFLSCSMVIPSTGEAQCRDYNERVYNFTRQQKGCNTKESRNFRSQFTTFIGVSQILFWGSFHLFLAVNSLRSSLRPLKTPPCRTSVAKRQRESGAQGLGSFSWRDGWITRNPWVWSPLMEIFCVKNTDFRDQTKELLE